MPDIPLDVVSFEEYLSTAPEVAQLVQDALAAGFEFSTNESLGRANNSESLALFRQLGITTVGHLKELIQASQSWSLKYLAAVLKHGKTKWAGDAGFFSVLVVIGHHRKRLTADHLVATGWNKEIAETVLEVESSSGDDV